MWVTEGFNFARMLLGLATMVYVQRLLFKFLTLCFLTREFKNDKANTAFWTGKWYNTGMGWMAFTQPSREFVAKIIEMSEFAGDFMLAHIILFCQLPILCIPLIDRWHSMMLFWLKPSRLIRPPIYSLKQARLRKRMVRKYCVLYFTVLIMLVVIIAAPAAASGQIAVDQFANIGGSGSIANGLFNQEMSVIMILVIINQNHTLEFLEYPFHWYYQGLFHKSILESFIFFFNRNHFHWFFVFFINFILSIHSFIYEIIYFKGLFQV